MDLFPVFMDLGGRDCLVVGGGTVAARKLGLLLRAGASVEVVAPQLCEKLVALRDAGKIRHSARAFEAADVEGKALVIAATSREAVNRSVSELAKARNIPVNVVDQPELCSFIVPSIIDRSPVQVAVSSGATSPVLARLLRARLESYVPAAYGQLAKLVESFRDRVKMRFGSIEQRRQFWENMLQGEVAELLFAGRDETARAVLEKALQDSDDEPHPVGEVYLVGAGPGDPDLLTFRALHLQDGSVNLNWKALAHPNQTTVFYMGLHGVGIVAGELIRHGLPQTTPVALIQQGTTQNQRVLICDLRSLEDTVKTEQIKPPTIIIVGEVVKLHETLQWFKPLPGANPRPFGGHSHV